MSGFLGRLVDRTLSGRTEIRPRPVSLYEATQAPSVPESNIPALAMQATAGRERSRRIDPADSAHSVNAVSNMLKVLQGATPERMDTQFAQTDSKRNGSLFQRSQYSDFRVVCRSDHRMLLMRRR